MYSGGETLLRMSRRPDWLHRLMTVDKAVQAKVEVEDRGIQTEDQDLDRERGSSLKDHTSRYVEQVAPVPHKCVERLVELPSYKAWRWR